MGSSEFGPEEARGEKVTKPPPGLALFFSPQTFYELFLQGKKETLCRLFLFQLSLQAFYGGHLVRFAAFYGD